MEQSTVALIITIITIALFISEKIPMAVVAILSMVAMAMSGCITYSEAFAGFSSTAVLMMIGIGIMGKALMVTGFSEKIGQAFMRINNMTEKKFLILVVASSLLISVFLNGIIVIAIFMPIIDSLVLKTGGKISKKNLYLPAGIAALIGGNLSVIGSTSILTASGLLEASSFGRGFGFFEPAILGLPACVVLLLFIIIFGTKPQERFFNFAETPIEIPETKDPSKNKVTEWKQRFVIGVIVFCAVAWILGFNYGTIALIGASLVIIAKCIDIKTAMEGVNWSCILVVAGTLGFAKGVEQSGAGLLITEKLLEICGSFAKSPAAMCVILLFLCTLLSHFMSNTGVICISVPIALSIASSLGAEELPFVMTCAMGASFAVATPVCAAAVTVTAAAGYGFKDDLKYGGILNLLFFIATSIALVLIYF